MKNKRLLSAVAMIGMALVFSFGIIAIIGSGGGGGDSDPPRAVHTSGDATIKGTWNFDFDSGTGGGNIPYAPGAVNDVWWERITATQSKLVPRNGARFAVLGIENFGAVSWEQASTTTLSNAEILDTNLNVGTVIVYITNAGRYGKFRINGFSGNQNLAISWVTWL